MTNFNDIPAEYERIASENALSIAKSKIAKDKLKQKLASLTAHYMASQDIPTSKAEALARASEEYKEYLSQCEQELYKAEVAKSKLKALEMEFDYCRSQNSLEKAKIKLL